MKNILKCLNVFFFFLQEETNPGSIAESKDNAFPFLIFMGTLASPGKIYIAADKQIIAALTFHWLKQLLHFWPLTMFLCIIILLD